MNEEVRVTVFVSGKVQGVFFRQNAKKMAKELGLKGWVKNLPNGKVEAVIEGKKEVIERLVEWMKKGPFLSKVDDLKVNWQEAKKDLEDFQIIY